MSSNNSDNKLHTATFAWTIDDFPTLEAKGCDKSSDFSAPDNNNIKWNLMLKPNGKNDAKNTISLYLCLKDYPRNQRVFATFEACILHGDNFQFESCSKRTQVLNCGETTYGWRGTRCWGWKNFCIKDKKFKRNLLPNNTLKICVEVTFSEILVDLINSCNKMSLRSNAHGDDLYENITSLLETQEFSDIVLSAKGNDFPAHKLILAARSKVFAAMFHHDNMQENQENRVKIEDMSKESVAEMLRFIYTGRCEKLDELAEELLAAADKYDLNGLKILSGRALFQTLSPENASNVLILSDTHNAKELKNDVLEFIVPNSVQVFSTASWKNVLANSELVDEVFQAFARQITYKQVEEFDRYN